MHDLSHADEGMKVEEDGERVEHVGEYHPRRLSEHLDLILLRLRVFQQETEKLNEVNLKHLRFRLGLRVVGRITKFCKIL